MSTIEEDVRLRKRQQESGRKLIGIRFDNIGKFGNILVPVSFKEVLPNVVQSSFEKNFLWIAITSKSE